MIDPEKTVVITGVGAVSPYGMGFATLEAGVLSGKCCLQSAGDIFQGFSTCIARTEAYPAVFDGHYSRTDHLAILAARDAVGALADRSLLSESGVVMASTVAGLSEIDSGIAKGPAAWYRNGGLERAATYRAAHVASAVSDDLRLGGPACTVSVACASGAMAIALAANLLLDGAAPMMLAGGSDALCQFTLSGFNSLQSLDCDPCRPFDRNRKGLNLGEGAAVLMLETLASARRRNAQALAVLRGWAMTNDASHLTAPHKDGAGIALCLERALAMAGCSVDEVGYINAHGTGTPLNDAAETRGYELAFRAARKPVPVSSTKSYIGHCLGAAGAMEAAITLSALRCGVLLPNLRLTDPIESNCVELLQGALRYQPMSTAISVSAGFGGSNAALVFGDCA